MGYAVAFVCVHCSLFTALALNASLTFHLSVLR